MYEAAGVLAFSLGFLACFASTPIIMKRMREAGIVGPDAHKRGHPEVPEMGGIGILIGLAVSVAGVCLLSPERARTLAPFLTVVLITGLVGALDDLKPLNPIVKPALTALAGLPILLTGNYSPHMVLPIVGPTRLTIVYPLMIPLAVAVPANAVNMMDAFNGEMPSTCLIIVLVLLISSVLLPGRSDAALACAGLLGCLIAYYHYNRYPARTFAGDVGSLSVGAAIGTAAIIGRLEAVAVVAFTPQIMNAFYGLATIGRLYERREVPRPTRLLGDGRLAASGNPKAPITLTRMVLARGPLSEQEIVRVFVILQAISSVLALFTLYLVSLRMFVMIMVAPAALALFALHLGTPGGRSVANRRILDFVYILLFAWTCMLLGMWIIDELVVPLSLPLPGWWGRALASVLKAVISAVLALAWLWIWRGVVRTTFWRILKKGGYKE